MKRILVIEDSDALLNDITEMLRLEGFTPISAENGFIGIQKAEQEKPDLIVCDIRMPIVDGYGVLDHIRSNPNTANIPFIFLTARTGRSEMREGMQSGADDYLTKPFTAEELISSINSRLARRVQQEQATEQRLEALRRSIALALPHEMRTPLNAILGFSEILMTDGKHLSESQTLEMSTHIYRSAQRLYRLIENYVIYTNLETIEGDEERQAHLRSGRVSYVPIVLAQLAQEKAIKFDREADLVVEMFNNENTLTIDSENFNRIAYELLDNAFKFSKKGTRVHVSMHVESEHLFVFEIVDHGTGMTDAEIELIGAYMQFKRDVLEQQGVGLGLVIAQKMTELHGGHFSISSVPDEYTRVSVALPIAHDNNHV